MRSLGRRTEILIVAAASLVVALLFGRGVFEHFENWGIADWDQHLFYHEVPRLTVAEYGQIPLWNPYECGGTVMLANPQSRCGSPTFLLLLMFGTVHGVKLDLLLHFALGIAGAYALARSFRLGPAASSIAGIVFMCNAAFPTTATHGMTWVFSIAYIPWMWLGYRLGLKKAVWILLGGTAGALVFLNGGAYIVAITGVLLAALAVTDSVARRNLRPVGIVAAMLIVAGALSAFKLIPALEYMHRNPRPIDEYSGFSVSGLLYCLFDPYQQSLESTVYNLGPGLWTGTSYYKCENLMYVGISTAALIICGLALQWPDKRRLLIVTAAMLWICFGDRVTPSLWAWIHGVPPFTAMRVSQRFRFPLLLCLALVAASGFERARILLVNKYPRLSSAASISVALCVFFELLSANGDILYNAFALPPLHIDRSASFQQISQLPPYSANGYVAERTEEPGILIPASSLFPAVLSNLGTVAAYETMSALRSGTPRDAAGYRGEAYLEETDGTAEILYFSPCELKIRVRASGAGNLIINQNWDPWWGANGGRSITRTDRSLMSVPIESGESEIVLRYKSTPFLIGSMISFASLIGAAIVAARVVSKNSNTTNTLCA